jgi:pimeloyl-ACP methyl ester carboxylesterase
LKRFRVQEEILGHRRLIGWITAAFGAVALTGSAASTLPTLRLEDCRLESSVGQGAASARCAWFDVAENRADRNSRRIRIRVGVIPALRREPLVDPVFIISGGPGQAASDFYLASSRAFDSLHRDRDLVIVDQRGTGRSNRLDCALPDELESARFDLELIKGYTRTCLGKLGGDPRFYSTSVAVLDLDEIRAALGYSKINLYGISYGTRVAQHYLRRYPQHVRTVVLDGIVPVDVALGPEVAPAAQNVLDAILNRCVVDTKCHERFANIKTELEQLRTKLASNSIAVVVPDPSTAIETRVDFSYMHLAIALRLHSYSDKTASLLPFLIHEAAQNRLQPLAAQALLVARSLNEQLANGMHNAVVCTEDVPFITEAALNDPAIERSYLRRIFIDTLRAMCSVWPRGVLDDQFHAPFRSDVPLLALSGENDPVTPADYGKRASQNFSNAKHVIVPGQGHGQLNNPCISRVMTRFIDQGSNADLDLSCVGKQTAAPFMLNATSPGP